MVRLGVWLVPEDLFVGVVLQLSPPPPPEPIFLLAISRHEVKDCFCTRFPDLLTM